MIKRSTSTGFHALYTSRLQVLPRVDGMKPSRQRFLLRLFGFVDVQLLRFLVCIVAVCDVDVDGVQPSRFLFSIVAGCDVEVNSVQPSALSLSVSVAVCDVCADGVQPSRLLFCSVAVCDVEVDGVQPSRCRL